MNPEQAFLQAILESPGDDAPRLIFADWLEERGDAAGREWAEFIRVQFALRDLPPEHPLRPQLEEREQQLRLANENDWLKPLRTKCAFERCAFRRGFVEKIVLSVEQWARQAETLFTLAPIQEIGFTTFYERLNPNLIQDIRLNPNLIQDIVESPLLRRLIALDLSNPNSMTTEIHAYILSSPQLCGLKSLSVMGWQRQCAVLLRNASCLSNLTSLCLRGYAGGSELEELFRSDHLSKLTTLDLCGALGRSNPEIRRFIQVARLPSLTTLDLRGNSITTGSVQALAKSDLAPRLERLYLGQNPLGDLGVSALTKSGRLNRLKLLDLSASQIGTAGVSALARCRDLEQLSALHLRSNRLGDAGLRRLCGAPALANLSVLHISDNRIGARGARSLVQSPPGRLAVLDLSWNPLSDDAVIDLAAAPALETLAALDLSYCQLGDAAARALANSPYLNNLHTLNLSTNRITDAGIAALANASGLPSLTALNLGYNALGDSGLRTLLASPRFRRLTALNLTGNRINPALLHEMRREYRGCLGG